MNYSDERPEMQLAEDRKLGQIRENRDALRFREPPYSEPSANNGESTLREINNKLLDAIENGEFQYGISIWDGTLQDIEAHLENTGYEYGGWSHIECWFDDFAIAAGLCNQSVDNIAAPGSGKADLIFAWEA